MSSPVCLNCERSNPTSAKYCQSCGQKTHLHPLSGGALAHEIFHYFTHVEKNIFYLIGQLFIRPGIVAKKYLAGKRKLFFPPVNFFLIAAGLCVLSGSLLHTFDRAFYNPKLGVVLKKDPLYSIVTTHINWIFMILTPLTSFLYHLFYRKSKLSYFEHLAAGLYWTGFLLLLLALVFNPLFAITGNALTIENFMFAFLLVQVLYYTRAYYQLLPGKGFVRAITHLFINVLVFFIWFLLAVTAIVLYNIARR